MLLNLVILKPEGTLKMYIDEALSSENSKTPLNALKAQFCTSCDDTD